MTALINSFLLVLFSEMGDKTQLFALVLAARLKRFDVLLASLFLASLVNHGIAALLGSWMSAYFSHETLRALLALSFIAIAIWMLIPDREVRAPLKTDTRFFVKSFLAFLLLGLGDKTQFTALALGARYSQPFVVMFGTSLGVVAANALALYAGARLPRLIPLRGIRLAACGLMVLFGLLTFFRF